MSLSRLPQVALRRLVPAITAVPKSLDDEQLKKMLEPQPNIKALSKLDTASLPATMQQGLIATLAKSTAGAMPPAIGRLLMNLSGTQGVLSSQDLALIRAASAKGGRGSDDVTPEPASPSGMADAEPRAGALDAASVDALVTALRGTAAISTDDAGSGAEAPARRRIPMRAGPVDSAEHSEGEDAHPLPADMSAAERRKEQNRRAQKKFRQKDKVRQKEVKWRASQYDTLVENNKRFKRDIDAISRERDQYRRILERHGIKVDSLEEDTKISAVAPVAVPQLSAMTNVLPEIANSLPEVASASPSLTASTNTMVSPALSPQAPLGMDQIAQDTFGPWMHSQPTATMNDLLSSLVFGAVRADPMFAAQPSVFASSAEPLAAVSAPLAQPSDMWFDSLRPTPSSDPLLVESPLLVDQSAIDAQYVQHSMLDSQLVDPMAFIDELLASPSLSSNAYASDAVSRKRSYDDAMF
ncbi:hypothetical protein IWW50_001269 [Coemansia erecta]|nr:hypothetical protein IWW50_001269 [Coemansia erecta]